MSYKIVTDKIEVRSLIENNQPRYIVRGTAIIPNKKHIYQYSKNKDGTYKTLKSMFTPHCIQSIKEQSKHKKLFVDIQHELAINANLKKMLKGKITPEDETQLNSYLKTKMLPLAKLNNIDILDDRMDIETEFNPMFKEVDIDHKNYFDAVWYSLQNKYLNGISINFGDFKYATDNNNDMVIDDVDVLGFSFLDSPAEPENSIYEVAIRAMQEGINIRAGEERMESEKLEQERKKLEDERAIFLKQKTDFENAQKEAVKKVEIDKQITDQKKMLDELDNKTNALKSAQEESAKLKEELNRVKGVVAQNQHNLNRTNAGSSQYDAKFYESNLREITADHDKTIETIRAGKTPLIDNTMKGWAELVNLQAKAGNYTADLDARNADDIRFGKLLERSPEDIVIQRKTG